MTPAASTPSLVNTFPPPRVYARITGSDGAGNHSWVQVNEGNASLANYTTVNFALNGNLTVLYAREANGVNVANGTVVRLDLAYSNEFYIFNFNSSASDGFGSVVSNGTGEGNATRLSFHANGIIDNYAPLTNITYKVGDGLSNFPIGQRLGFLTITNTDGDTTPMAVPAVPANTTAHGWVTTIDQGYAGRKDFDRRIRIADLTANLTSTLEMTAAANSTMMNMTAAVGSPDASYARIELASPSAGTLTSCVTYSHYVYTAGSAATATWTVYLDSDFSEPTVAFVTHLQGTRVRSMNDYLTKKTGVWKNGITGNFTGGTFEVVGGIIVGHT